MKKFILLTLIIFGTLHVKAQWYPVNSNTAENLYDIVFLDSLEGYCVGGGDQYGFPDGDGTVLKTIDGGENWSTIFSEDSLSIHHIAIVEEGNQKKLYGFATKYAVPYLVSTFIASPIQNWTVDSVNYQVTDVQVNDNVIYFSDDQDQSLKKMQNSIITNVRESVSIFSIDSDGLMWLDTGVDSAFVSYDFGVTIDIAKKLPTEMGQNQSLNSKVQFNQDTLLVFGTYMGVVTFTTSNTNNWTTNYNECGKATILNNKIMYCTETLNRIMLTTNSGVSWQTQDTMSFEINEFYFYDNNLVFAIGEKGNMLKMTSADHLNIKTINTLKKNIDIYPNPAKNTITIETKENIEFSEIALFDLSGKKVRNYNVKEKKLNVSGLKGGQYILQLKTIEGWVSKKIVIE